MSPSISSENSPKQSLPALKNLKLAMFDLDGTLVDSVPDLAIAIDKMLADLNRPVVGVEKVRDWVGNGGVMLVKRALADDMAGNCTAELFAKAHPLFMHYYADQHSLTCTYDGVLDGLQWLQNQGVKMAVVTNKPYQFVEDILKTQNMIQYFDFWIGGDSLPEKKPHPQPLLHTMAHFNVTAAQCIMVGDSKNDVGAARNAKVAVVCLPYGYNHGEDIADSQPDALIERLDLISHCFN
ncbi:phosphoglycolate phosphatase [Pelagibaculum spongiae]|uniref:Phosphoglycolate phosphatase n=1 Tax=Pelagibaculum spongiae TaxID=2080658 RepID=A0A2V1GPY9_9GAMM|nr:phosphoglycolate phosphatase [Pelagibaculum spongiae]PVZ65406.1 phosphoglycolate phosphatase [Pelagibaculum spongiae]